MAQPWLRLATRLISPLRTYHSSPLSARSVVTRSPISTTVPLASPASIRSPTPYWSSSSMNMPLSTSVTRLRAPKPIATPRIPALAIRGPSSMLSWESTISAAVPSTRTEAAERSTEPMAAARWMRRSGLASRAEPREGLPARRLSSRCMRLISRLIDRRTITRSTRAMTTISAIRRPVPSQASQCSLITRPP